MIIMHIIVSIYNTHYIPILLTIKHMYSKKYQKLKSHANPNNYIKQNAHSKPDSITRISRNIDQSMSINNKKQMQGIRVGHASILGSRVSNRDSRSSVDVYRNTNIIADNEDSNIYRVHYQPKLTLMMLADSDITQNEASSSRNIQKQRQTSSNGCTKMINIIKQYVNHKDNQQDNNPRSTNNRQQFKENQQSVSNKQQCGSHVIYERIEKVSKRIRFNVENFVTSIKDDQPMSTKLQFAVQNLLLNMLSIANNLYLLILDAQVQPKNPIAQQNSQSQNQSAKQVCKYNAYKSQLIKLEPYQMDCNQEQPSSRRIAKKKKLNQHIRIQESQQHHQQQSCTPQASQMQEQQQDQQLQGQEMQHGEHQSGSRTQMQGYSWSQLPVLRQCPSAEDLTSSIDNTNRNADSNTDLHLHLGISGSINHVNQSVNNSNAMSKNIGEDIEMMHREIQKHKLALINQGMIKKQHPYLSSSIPYAPPTSHQQQQYKKPSSKDKTQYNKIIQNLFVGFHRVNNNADEYEEGGEFEQESYRSKDNIHGANNAKRGGIRQAKKVSQFRQIEQNQDQVQSQVNVGSFLKYKYRKLDPLSYSRKRLDALRDQNTNQEQYQQSQVCIEMQQASEILINQLQYCARSQNYHSSFNKKRNFQTQEGEDTYGNIELVDKHNTNYDQIDRHIHAVKFNNGSTHTHKQNNCSYSTHDAHLVTYTSAQPEFQYTNIKDCSKYFSQLPYIIQNNQNIRMETHVGGSHEKTETDQLQNSISQYYVQQSSKRTPTKSISVSRNNSHIKNRQDSHSHSRNSGRNLSNKNNNIRNGVLGLHESSNGHQNENNRSKSKNSGYKNNNYSSRYQQIHRNSNNSNNLRNGQRAYGNGRNQEKQNINLPMQAYSRGLDKNKIIKTDNINKMRKVDKTSIDSYSKYNGGQANLNLNSTYSDQGSNSDLRINSGSSNMNHPDDYRQQQSNRHNRKQTPIYDRMREHKRGNNVQYVSSENRNTQNRSSTQIKMSNVASQASAFANQGYTYSHVLSRRKIF